MNKFLAAQISTLFAAGAFAADPAAIKPLTAPAPNNKPVAAAPAAPAAPANKPVAAAPAAPAAAASAAMAEKKIETQVRKTIR